MVVTFVIGSLEYICNVLDLKRLNKQKVEANQILNASLGLTKGWANHPAVLMWKGYSNALKHYFNEITHACIRRGFNNNMPFYEFTEEQLNNIEYQSIQDYLQNKIPIEASTNKIIFPWWFQWKPLIYSHQSSLLRKNPKYYNIFFHMLDEYEYEHGFDRDELKEYLNVGYLWPHKLSSEQIEICLPSYCDAIGTGAPATYRWTREEVEEWLNDVYVNPKTGRGIKPTKSGVYSDLKKAAKLYGYDISDDIDIKVNYLNVIKENKDIINNNKDIINNNNNSNNNNNMQENKEKLIDTSIQIENVNENKDDDEIELTFNVTNDNKSDENNKIVNRGTGAGGSNTTYYGKKFEEKTNNYERLLNMGYTKNKFSKKSKEDYEHYLSKIFEDKTITFVLQGGFKKYIKHKYNIDVFRSPDEAYIVEYNIGEKIIKILEKKEQNVAGSVETKLWAGPSLKREYEIVLGDNFKVYYGFCVSDFLKNKLTSLEKKYMILNTILNENNISVLFGDDEDYFEKNEKWVNNSL